MNVKRICAVIVIFLGATAAWAVLGFTTAERSLGSSKRLAQQVESLWGVPLVQQAPLFSVADATYNEKWLMPILNNIDVKLETDYRKRGLIWYPTYVATFHGTYALENTTQQAKKVDLEFKFPSTGGTYDAFAATFNGV